MSYRAHYIIVQWSLRKVIKMAALSFYLIIFVIGQALASTIRTTPPTTCSYKGKTYQGSFWTHPCGSCSCVNGQALCWMGGCVPPPCEHDRWVSHPEVCCPLCSGECYHGSHYIKPGETYYPDSYTECRCPSNSGVATCSPRIALG